MNGAFCARNCLCASSHPALAHRAGFAACVLARSGRCGGLGHALRDFCVAGNASALVRQVDRGRQPQHAVASVLARGGWAAAAAAAAEVDRSYLVLAVNTLQAPHPHGTPAPSPLPQPSPSPPLLQSVLFNRLAAHRMSLGLHVLPSDLVQLPDGSIGAACTSAQQHSLDDVLLPLVGTKTLLPSYAADVFCSNPPDAAVAALASPPAERDACVSSATKKAAAQPGS